MSYNPHENVCEWFDFECMCLYQDVFIQVKPICDLRCCAKENIFFGKIWPDWLSFEKDKDGVWKHPDIHVLYCRFSFV
jgi:hypothetical protein